MYNICKCFIRIPFSGPRYVVLIATKLVKVFCLLYCIILKAILTTRSYMVCFFLAKVVNATLQHEQTNRICAFGVIRHDFEITNSTDNERVTHADKWDFYSMYK